MKEVKITNQRKIVIQIQKWKGRTNLDIRSYVETANYSGPTPKGFSIPPEKGEELAEAIKEVLVEWKNNLK
jgi:hypothetical protein